MTVGLYIDWQRSDEVMLAVPLLRQAERNGCDVQIMPTGKAANVHPAFDGRVLRNYNGSLDNWLEGLSHVITFDARYGPVIAGGKAKTAKSVLVMLWSALSEPDRDYLYLFDRILCPGLNVSRHLRGEQLRTHCLPWHLDLPVIRRQREIDAERLGFCWYLDGSQSRVQSGSFVRVIADLLRYSDAFATVCYAGRLPADCEAELRDVQQNSNGRLVLEKNAPWPRLYLTMGASDLILCPAFADDAGLPALMALSCGTPCITYDIAVTSEVITDQVNGVLVPCDLRCNWFNVPHAQENNEHFLDKTLAALSNIDLLHYMRSRTGWRFNNRKEIFVNATNNLFNA